MPSFAQRRCNATARRATSSTTAADLRAFRATRLDAKAPPGEIDRELAIVRRAFRLAVKGDRYHGRVPSFELLDERDRVRTGFFDDASIAAVLANLAPALHPVVRFSYVTGWRVQSEILLWTEPEALPNKGLACPSVFHRKGEAIKSFRKSWAAACEAAGYPGRLLHDLRRSAVRNLVRAGVPDMVAMKITGHKTRSVFDRYDITSGVDVRDGLGRLATAPAPSQPGKQRGKGRSA
jgi:hypothetical protein